MVCQIIIDGVRNEEPKGKTGERAHRYYITYCQTEMKLGKPHCMNRDGKNYQNMISVFKQSRRPHPHWIVNIRSITKWEQLFGYKWVKIEGDGEI